MVQISDLKQLDFFKMFSPNQLEALGKITEKKTYKANQHVYEHGEPAEYLFVVNKGMVSLKEIKPDDEVGITFEMRKRGEIFGAACLMEPQKYTLTAVCLEDCELLAIDADALSRLCRQDAELDQKFMKKIAQIYFERYKAAKRQIYEMNKDPSTITALPG